MREIYHQEFFMSDDGKPRGRRSRAQIEEDQKRENEEFEQAMEGLSEKVKQEFRDLRDNPPKRDAKRTSVSGEYPDQATDHRKW